MQARLKAQLPHTLNKTHFSQLGELYEGKVRDVYRRGDRLVLVTTDRVSAFDHVLGTVPFKGQVLNELAVDALKATEDLCKNHLISCPDPNVVVVERCAAYPVEFVVRGYITGSLWRDYEAGRAGVYGVPLPEGLKKDEQLPAPILTPTTKAELGAHDMPISAAEILAQGLLTEAQLQAATELAFKLYARGVERAAARGLILVDTKYELGEDAEGQLRVIDELHTPDSSRYWEADSYAALLSEGKPQRMLDKENLRGWLIETHGFSGQGTPPALSEEIRVELGGHYLKAYERLLGRPFSGEVGPVEPRIEARLRAAGLL